MKKAIIIRQRIYAVYLNEEERQRMGVLRNRLFSKAAVDRYSGGGVTQKLSDFSYPEGISSMIFFSVLVTQLGDGYSTGYPCKARVTGDSSA